MPVMINKMALLLLATSFALGAAAEVDRSNEVAIEGAASGDLELHPAAEQDVCTKYSQTSTQAASTLCMGDLATKTLVQTSSDQTRATVSDLAQTVSDLAAHVDDSDGVIETLVQTSSGQTRATVSDLAQTVSDIASNDLAGIRIESQSAGGCDGNFFKVWLSGQEVQNDPVTNKGPSRGINAIVIDVDAGTATSRHSFDTCCAAATADYTSVEITAQENQRLRDFIALLPEGQVVAFGIKGEGAYRLEAATKAALETMGARHVYNVGFRESWTMIGVKGLRAGAAREHYGGTQNAPNVGACPHGATPDDSTGGAKSDKISQFFNTGALSYLNGERASLAGSTAEAIDEVASNAPFVRTVSVQSAGACGGDYFKVWIDQVEVHNDVVSNDRTGDDDTWSRGINAIVIDVFAGTAVSRHNFDTCCGHTPTGRTTAEENQRLRDFVDKLPEGKVVVFGIKGDGANQLEDESMASLAVMGSSLAATDQVQLRESWSMIGIKRTFVNEQLDVGHAYEHHGGTGYTGDGAESAACKDKTDTTLDTKRMDQKFLCVGKWCMGNVVA